MLIVCPSCISTYRMPADAIRGHVAAVRCAQCSGVFEPARADLLSLPQPAGGAPAGVLAAPAGVLSGVRPRSSRPVRDIGNQAKPSRRPVAAVLVVLLAIGMGTIAQRERIVAVMPAAAAPFAALGLHSLPAELVLGGVSTALADEGRAKVLTLQGTITNSRATVADVPNLRIVVRDATEQDLYSWVAPAPRTRLAPGETMDFSSRLVSPPANGHDLVVSFADQTDGAAPAKVETRHERQATSPGPVRP